MANFWVTFLKFGHLFISTSGHTGVANDSVHFTWLPCALLLVHVHTVLLGDVNADVAVARRAVHDRLLATMRHLRTVQNVTKLGHIY